MNRLTIKMFKKLNPVRQEKVTIKLLFALFLLSISSLASAAQVIEDYVDNDWPDTRYDDQGDGTVTDIKTGLMWKQCSEGQSGDTCADDGLDEEFNWSQALEHAENHTFAGYSDWRVPNIKELLSLMARDRWSPTINNKLFPGAVSHASANHFREYFWSSTPSFNEKTGVVSFHSGLSGVIERTKKASLRLVRGGQ